MQLLSPNFDLDWLELPFMDIVAYTKYAVCAFATLLVGHVLILQEGYELECWVVKMACWHVSFVDVIY